MIVVVMGVSGVGKSTFGKLLAQQLGWTFIEGDDFHPRANIEKMERGIPLTDEDRAPWLDAIGNRLKEARARGENVVLACSALKHSYQHYLAHFAPESIRFVFLYAPPEVIRQRLEARTGHFMKAALLTSQLQTLEPPEDAVSVDAAGPPEKVVAEIRSKLGI